MKKNKGVTILTGLGLGLVEAILLLAILRTGNYVLFDVAFFVGMIVVTTIPFCIRFLEGFDLKVANIGILMTSVSLVISILYCLFISKSTSTFLSLLLYVALIHIPSFLVLFVWHYQQEARTVHR